MSKKYIDIAVGVLQRNGKYCLSRRQKHQSFADRWEFPGGKVERGETVLSALVREFREELAIETSDWQPLIEIPWDYGDVQVCLQVYQTSQFIGEPHGNEGQDVVWFDLDELSKLSFPEANQGILTALQLTERYMISGQFDSPEDALNRLNHALQNGIKLCQLRAKQLSAQAFDDLAEQAIELAHKHSAKILLNGQVELLQTHPCADGLQLASNRIYEFDSRPISEDKLLGVSTHTAEDIQQAIKIGADFILLSPVKETSSHPGVEGIGWDAFAEQIKMVPVPVFALGGMKVTDLNEAKKRGGQGIAAISGFWPS